MCKGTLIVILGPTACGKSDLGVQLAKRFSGEIVSADSRQIYRGLDLGTGKITPSEMDGVPHFMLDILDPGEPYSAAQFQQDAYSAIDAILERKKLPFLVGGTGLYLRAVAEGYQFSSVPPDPALRAELEGLSVAQLRDRLLQKGVPLGEDAWNNRPRLVRLLEKAQSCPDPHAERERIPRYSVLTLGVAFPRETICRRIDARLHARLEAGMLDEERRLLAAGVPDRFLEGLGLEYRYMLWYLEGKFPSKAVFIDELGRAIKRFAKRQMSWFRKDRHVHWLNMAGDPLQEASEQITAFLSADAVSKSL